MARPDEIGQHDTERERHRGHGLEIDQRLDADPADLLEIARCRNAMHHHAEDDGRHHHGDELQEGVAQDLEADREIWRPHAEQDTEEQRHHHLDEKRFCRAGRGQQAQEWRVPSWRCLLAGIQAKIVPPLSDACPRTSEAPRRQLPTMCHRHHRQPARLNDPVFERLCRPQGGGITSPRRPPCAPLPR